MKQLRGKKDGGHPKKKVSSSGKNSSTPPGQTSEESGQINILNPQLLAQKRPLQNLNSTTGGNSAGSADDAKRPKLLPEVISPGHESEDESDDDYERLESDNDGSDDTSSEEEDDDETGSDASESSSEDHEEASRPSSRSDLTKGKG